MIPTPCEGRNLEKGNRKPVKADLPALRHKLLVEAGTVQLDAPQMIRELSIVFGDGRALEDVRKMVLDEKAALSARQSALKTLIDALVKDKGEAFVFMKDGK